MIYQINDSYLENVRTFLSKKAKFVGRFRKENGGGFVKIYNLKPSTIILHENEIEIVSELGISELYSKSQLEQKAGKIK